AGGHRGPGARRPLAEAARPELGPDEPAHQREADARRAAVGRALQVAFEALHHRHRRLLLALARVAGNRRADAAVTDGAARGRAPVRDPASDDGGRHLPGPRRARLRIPALAAREAAADDEAGGEGRSEADG